MTEMSLLGPVTSNGINGPTANRTIGGPGREEFTWNQHRYLDGSLVLCPLLKHRSDGSVSSFVCHVLALSVTSLVLWENTMTRGSEGFFFF